MGVLIPRSERRHCAQWHDGRYERGIEFLASPQERRASFRRAFSSDVGSVCFLVSPCFIHSSARADRWRAFLTSLEFRASLAVSSGLPSIRGAIQATEAERFVLGFLVPPSVVCPLNPRIAPLFFPSCQLATLGNCFGTLSSVTLVTASHVAPGHPYPRRHPCTPDPHTSTIAKHAVKQANSSRSADHPAGLSTTALSSITATSARRGHC